MENRQNDDSFRRSFWSLGLHNITTASVVAVGRFHSFRRSKEMGDISTPSEGVEREGVVEIAAVAGNLGNVAVW